MPGYIIVDIDIRDAEAYEEYKLMTPPTLKLYDGRFVVRGGHASILEGEWQPKRLVVLEFPTVERARQWWDSPEYRPARELRQRIAHTNMIVVEGFSG